KKLMKKINISTYFVWFRLSLDYIEFKIDISSTLDHVEHEQIDVSKCHQHRTLSLSTPQLRRTRTIKQMFVELFTTCHSTPNYFKHTYR
ncbi:MAG: hypothetical protein K0U52_04665, partial [Gammaproteobacteria bacterium]|nr:hypothetical protein [Gammaproteobacteria bacterium]